MNKSALEKSLVKAPAKKRALIIANHMASIGTDGTELLTESELQGLVDSFKTDNEIKTYTHYQKVFDNVQNYLAYLSQFRLGYLEALGRLDKLVLLKKSNADMEDLINSLLELMPDKKTKDKALDIVETFSNPALLRFITKDSEGYVQILQKDKVLDEAILKHQETVRDEQSTLKTGIAVIKDYFQETGFNIKPFAGFVKEIENWAKSKKGKDFTFILSKKLEAAHPGLSSLLEKNTLEIPYEQVEIDPKKYAEFRRAYLNA